MAQYTVPAIRRLQLGRELRDWRHRAGLTLGQAAGDLDMSKSALGRIEKGQCSLHPLHARAMAELYYVPDDERDRLINIAREAVKRNHNLIEGISVDSYPALEAEAVAVRNYELAYVPGLLQVEDYARALFTTGGTKERNRNLRIRMSRRSSLLGERPLRLHAIVDETALTRPIAPPTVLAEQLRHLDTMAALPHVTLQVVPSSTGMHPGLRGGFNVLTFPEDTIADLGYVDHAAGHMQVVKPEQVDGLSLRFNQIARIA